MQVSANIHKLLLLIAISCLSFFEVRAQTETKFDNRTSVSFGLIQPILGGFNITYTKQVSRFLFAYSHGSMLNLDKLGGAFKSKSAKEFDISQKTYISTGFDLGYRIVPDLSVRGEWKWHLHDLEHPAGDKVQFQTLTIGPSVYYQLHPFKGKAKNLMAEFSVRWWPVVYSSLKDHTYNFTNQNGVTEIFKHENGNLFAAVSIGWTLSK